MTKKPDYTVIWKDVELWVEAVRIEVLGMNRKSRGSGADGRGKKTI